MNWMTVWLTGKGLDAVWDMINRDKTNGYHGLQGQVARVRDKAEGIVAKTGRQLKTLLGRPEPVDRGVAARLRRAVEQTGWLPSGNRKGKRGQKKVEWSGEMPLILSWLAAAGLGAGLMYLFDPDRGNRRRALIRDQVVHIGHKAGDFAGKTGRDLQNRSQGLVARSRSLLQSDEPSDRVVAAQVREAMGRTISHPGAVSVIVQQGQVTLYGPILAHEVDMLLARLAAVPGVQEVTNNLDIHPEPGNVPGLQGSGGGNEPRFELLQDNWNPVFRLLIALTGGTLALAGLRRGGLLGALSSLLGLGLATRGLANKPVRRLVGIGTGRWAVDFQKTINVDAPVEEVFDFWQNYDNFPQFMTNIEEIKDLGKGQSHWVVKGPAGTTVEWDATLTEVVPNEVLAWQTQPEATVAHAGRVQFEPAGEDATRVTVRMSYNPPAGVAGHVVASLFGSNPRQEIDEDLVRLKSLLEEGKTSTEGQTVTREQVSESDS